MAEERLRKTNGGRLATMLNVVNAHATTPLNLSSALQHRERAKQIMEKTDECQAKLIATCADDTAMGVQEGVFAPIESTFHELMWKLSDIINSFPPSAGSSHGHGHGAPTQPINVKLPTLEAPTFDGNYAEWMSFKDLFNATVDSNTLLRDSQKLQYLKLSLQNEPATLIRNMEITDGNYKAAWKILKQRYDNEREIVASLARKLFEPKSLSKESAQGLQQLLDNTVECIRALNVLKQPTDHWDTLIVALLTSKIDPATHREWAIRHTSTTPPTFDEFSTFLMNHIRGLLATGERSNPNNTNNNQASSRKGKIGSHHVASSSPPKCQICEGSHFHFQCQQFHSLQPSERVALAAKHKLCFNCLRCGHMKPACPVKKTCKKCGKPHHTLLHEEKKPNSNRNSQSSQPREGQQQPNPAGAPEGNLSSHFTRNRNCVLLPTAIVFALDVNGERQPCRVFLDGGSEATFITEECSNRLGLPRRPGNLFIMGIGESSGGTTNGKVYTTLQSRLQQSSQFQMQFHVIARLTAMLPKYLGAVREWPHLRGLPLADPEYYIPQRVDILIGADYIGHVMLGGRRAGPLTAPVALETIFGWVITGQVPARVHHAIRAFSVSVEDIIKQFWEVEEPPKPNYLTEEEKKCDEHFLQHHTRDHEGRFIVGVPFNSNKDQLGSSCGMAIRRQVQVGRRLQRQPQHQQSYKDFMKEYESLGHMEVVPPEEVPEIPGKTFYLPHHFVTNESSSTTKLRVVFDGSAKSSSGLSLNDAIMVGPTIQDDLYALLLRFRTHPIVLKADITKMFRQFRLKKEDADMHRIVWRDNPSEPLQHFRLTTVTYGTACAPYLSTRCLKQLAVDSEGSYPEAAHIVACDTYMDDVFTGEKDEDSTMKLYHDLNRVMSSACLELRKWSSNSVKVLDIIPEDVREVNPHDFDDGAIIKALGVQWDPSSDHFKFKYVPVTPCETLTKRVLLSDLARVFDPLGLISPITVRAKLLLQELWKLSSGWDEPVPESIKGEWESYQEDIKNVTTFAFPRRITICQSTQQQIHGFCDASERAYGAVLYFRSINSEGVITSNMITSKTRVAPLRQVSLPRLELMGALLLAELTSSVQLSMKLSCDITLWTDSSITLTWIKGQPKRWKTFVANRVAKIHECTPISSWRHVPGVHNPADLCSRGVSTLELSSSSFWLNGPAWLSEQQLPIFPINAEMEEADMEERPPPVQVHHAREEFNLLERCSSLNRLKRVTAVILRGIHNAKSANINSPRRGAFTVAELEEALYVWVKKVQQHHFSDEISNLKSKKEVPAKSPLRTLVPFIDNRGIMRVSGRLRNANIPDDHKNMIILPAASHLTDIIIAYYHQLTLHGGFQLTFSTIYQRYWIQGGRNKIRFYVRSCVICRRHRAESAQQLMGQLPSARVQPARPFLHTGVDYAGPFLLKNPVGRAPKTYKGYMCLFVCMVTKAIHFEASSSLSTEDFLAAFSRFISRRGLCTNMYSDRGTNFIGADKELRKTIQSWESKDQIPDHLANKGIIWTWSPPSAPHHGGLFEAGVKSAKYHLRRVIGNGYLTYEQFSTLLCRVESILNSRPLHPISSDPSDVSALTPGHFLIGEPLLSIPSQDLSGIPTNRLNLYQRRQQMVHHFWTRWSQDYLTTLQQRNKWYWEQDNLKVGDLVLIVEDTAPGQWKMGRIQEVHPGDDGKVRVVTVKTATSVYKRAIVKLIPLLQQFLLTSFMFVSSYLKRHTKGTHAAALKGERPFGIPMRNAVY